MLALVPGLLALQLDKWPPDTYATYLMGKERSISLKKSNMAEISDTGGQLASPIGGQ